MEDHVAEEMFLMKWPELGKQVRLRKIEHNTEVFDWFMDNLPTSGIQSHTVVAGYALTCMSLPVKKPFTYRFADLKQENLVPLKKGRFILNMTIGNVINYAVKWGEMTEPMAYPSWAEVVDEDMDTLIEVGKIIWHNIVNEKKIIHVEYEKA